jgi:hypothetical protein
VGKFRLPPTATGYRGRDYPLLSGYSLHLGPRSKLGIFTMLGLDTKYLLNFIWLY